MRTRDPNEQRGKYYKLLSHMPMRKPKRPKFHIDDYGQVYPGKRPKKIKKKGY